MPYKHSVDTWGIAAVLFHLLCGHPAWTGTTENQGAVMLENIMHTPVQWERLEQAGVSDTGIDFLQKMLVIEPTQRATEEEQLQHPWITQVPRSDGSEMETDDMHQEAYPIPDASQLSLADQDSDGGSYSVSDETSDPRQSKRFRGSEPAPGPWEVPPIIKPDGTIRSWDSGGRLWPADPQPQADRSRPPVGDKLFGEISESAVRSSGVLGQDANVALGLPVTESHNGYSAISSVDPNYPPPEATGQTFARESAQNSADVVDNKEHIRDFKGHPAPSLMGAEALVSQLNMASPRSVASGPSTDSRDASSPESSIKRASRTYKPSPGLLVSSKGKSEVFKTKSSYANHRSASSANAVGEQIENHSPTQASQKGQMDPSHDGQGHYHVGKSNISLLPTTFNSEESEEDRLAGRNNGSQNSQAHGSPSTQGLTRAVLTDGAESTTRVKSPFRFGNLVPVPGSIPTVSIQIAHHLNTFGRDPSSNFPHPDLKANFVPKNALDITMFYPGMFQDIEKGSTSWHLRDDLTAIISTRTTRYIKVNGVRLMHGKDCWLYGKLHTGDIVTIFEPAEGREPKTEADKQFLKFRCEFFVGASKTPREANEPFVILKDENGFREHELRRSQEREASKSAASLH